MTDPRTPPERLPARAVDPAAVERAVELLTRCYTDDRITSDDLEDRLARVYHAATETDVAAAIADLAAAPGTASVPAPEPQRVSALLSGQEQRVTGVVPRRLELRGRLGYVEMDLRRATFEPGVTEIDVRALMGYVQIRLPAGLRVECLGRAVAGFFSVKGGGAGRPADSDRVVRITGRATMGFAEVFVARGPQPGDQLALPADDDR